MGYIFWDDLYNIFSVWLWNESIGMLIFSYFRHGKTQSTLTNNKLGSINIARAESFSLRWPVRCSRLLIEMLTYRPGHRVWQKMHISNHVSQSSCCDRNILSARFMSKCFLQSLLFYSTMRTDWRPVCDPTCTKFSSHFQNIWTLSLPWGNKIL